MFARRRSATREQSENRERSEQSKSSRKQEYRALITLTPKFPSRDFSEIYGSDAFPRGATASSNERVSLKLSATSARWNKTAPLISRLKRRQIA